MMSNCRTDKWALKLKWRVDERCICSKESVAENLEIEDSSFFYGPPRSFTFFSILHLCDYEIHSE